MDDRPPLRSADASVRGGVRRATAHDSARKHVSGEAVYVDDIPEPPGTLQLFAAQSERAHARIAKLDVSKVRTAPGVACALTADDVPGTNDVSPVGKHDDPIFARDEVEFVDIYDRFVGEDGKYSSSGPDLNGNRVRMRKDDGIHFSAAGADKLAFYLSQTIKNYYKGAGGVGIDIADALAGQLAKAD